MRLSSLIRNWLVVALGVVLAAGVFSGIRFDSFGSLAIAVILLSFFSTFLKPLLTLLTLPFVVLTLGLGIWIINALLFLLVGKLVPGFYVDQFTSALGGAFVVSLVGWIGSIFLGGHKVSVRTASPRPHSVLSSSGPNERNKSRNHSSLKDSDVIDI